MAQKPRSPGMPHSVINKAGLKFETRIEEDTYVLKMLFG